jgi:hypothetical protein
MKSLFFEKNSFLISIFRLGGESGAVSNGAWTLVGILAFFTIEVLFQENDEPKSTKTKALNTKNKKLNSRKNEIKLRSIKVELNFFYLLAE